MRSIENLKSIENKKILLRLDLNVPIIDGKIVDTNRIDKILPTINYLLKKKAKLIIISHVGRPNGKIVNDLSLAPISKFITEKIKKKVFLLKEDIFKIKKDEIFKNLNEGIILLENIRFYPHEEANDDRFSKKLASLGEIYVNDAFSCSHREHASVSKITNYIPAYCGLQINEEINALDKITNKIKKPVTCIIGGSKISTKIGLIKNLTLKLDNLIFVGGMANNILNYKGFKIGKSVKEINCTEIINDIFNNANENSCKIYYPQDVCIGTHMNSISEVKGLDNISDKDMILDIGPKTIKNIKKIIESSKTIFWNGPAGYFENENFSNGSSQIAKIIGLQTKKKSIFSVAGGGDTIAVINKTGNLNNFSFVSTAGGAFLEYLEGKELPGIKALN